MIRNIRSSATGLLFAGLSLLSLRSAAGDVTIIDSRHYSNVFGEMRNFRIFLPPGYYENPGKSYPVIYFYHGWSQRFFGSGPDSYNHFEKGSDNGGDNIAAFVSKNDVIVVKPDGYNRSQGEEYYLRPYNVLPVETYRQYPVYFPELVSFIDENYRTIPDRNHRAISGLSMGGFMSFWIGGKYPDLISAIGNFCGSSEFVVGPKDFPVEYRHIDMYRNYDGIKVRLNYGDHDFIRYYHRDLNRIWTQLMDNYEFHVYPAEHSTCGMGEMFSFLAAAFENPLPEPEVWNHTDVYPGFEVWNYKVSTDRDLPGFTTLENVSGKGFRCAVREHLPDGELMPWVAVTVETPPLYEKSASYLVNDNDLRTNSSKNYELKSDESGRLRLSFSGSLHDIGINRKGDGALISVAGFTAGPDNIARCGKDVILKIDLLNKGTAKAEGVKASLTAFRKNAQVIKAETEYGTIGINETTAPKAGFVFRIATDSVEIQKFRLSITDRNRNVWNEDIEVPLFSGSLPELNDFEIADGRVATVVREGIHEETAMLGTGNGDGVANPGESVVILVRDHGRLYRTFLTCHSKFINPGGVNERVSDNWGSYDHVGGSAKYSVPLIASDCPEGQVINLIAEYWLPDAPNHIIVRGTVGLKITGSDRTPPVLKWCRVTGDNVIQAKLCDGSALKKVKAELVNKTSPDNVTEFELKDDGTGGDREKNDGVYSFRVPEHGFGLYNISVSAVDSEGNTGSAAAPGYFVFH